MSDEPETPTPPTPPGPAPRAGEPQQPTLPEEARAAWGDLRELEGIWPQSLMTQAWGAERADERADERANERANDALRGAIADYLRSVWPADENGPLRFGWDEL